MRQFLFVIRDGLCKAHGDDGFDVVVLGGLKLEDGSGNMLNNPCICVVFCRLDLFSLGVQDSDPNPGSESE